MFEFFVKNLSLYDAVSDPSRGMDLIKGVRKFGRPKLLLSSGFLIPWARWEFHPPENRSFSWIDFPDNLA